MMNNSVAANELLARYIVFSDYIRQDRTIKPNAFMPQKDSLELSVTRHISLTENDLWNIGREIIRYSERTLYGRADVETGHAIAQKLSVMPQPVPNNPNHANIIGWPIEKNAQKMCALEIANAAHFVVNPEKAG
jgi:hypothetical protein